MQSPGPTTDKLGIADGVVGDNTAGNSTSDPQITTPAN